MTSDLENRERLFAHLQRGGAWAYYWTLPDKQSYWHPVGKNGIIPKGSNVYFGVHPTGTSKHINQRSKIDDVQAVNCLFAEFDTKDFGGNKAACKKHIDALPLTPSVIIDSGGGFHCYWLLDVTLMILGDAERTRINHVQKTWVSFVGSDDGAKDLARVLRVPGTKNAKYKPARPVTFVSADFDLLYGLEDLEAISAPQPPPAQEPATPATANTLRISYTQAALDGEIARVRSAREGSRNTALNVAAYSLGTLIGAGVLSQGDVETQLLSAALAVGLTEREAQRTIKSGLIAGIEKPRQIPANVRSQVTNTQDMDKTPTGNTSSYNTNSNIPNEEPGLPEIQTSGRELRDISADAMRSIFNGNVFVRSGELVRTKVDEKSHASIETMTESALRSMLARSANFFAWRKQKNPDGKTEFVKAPVAPPLEVVRDILALGIWDFPSIEGVVESPTMRPDGSIIKSPGYDAQTQLFYQPAPGFVLPPIPDHPTKKQANVALGQLHDVIADFPFEDDASHDNALGAMLTVVARPMIQGPVPIVLYDAPQQATGKTLLASISGLLSTGEMPDVSPAPTEPEEWRKAITAQLSTGRSVVIFDNVTHTLEDGSLAGATTATTWSDRLMGRNDRQIRVPARAVWMVTGNNIRVGGDLVSRCYLIRIDAKMSRPQEREDFKHTNLEQWVRDNRGLLIGAALTIARAWIEAGRPKPTCPKMRQEEWRKVIGGMLEYAGAAHFLRNQQRYYETADDDTPAWEAFITKLAEIWPKGMNATPGQIYMRFSADEALAEIVPDDLHAHLGAEDDAKQKSKFTQRLGYEFKARKGKRYGDSQARIEPAGTQSERKSKGGSMWQFIVERPEGL